MYSDFWLPKKSWLDILTIGSLNEMCYSQTKISIIVLLFLKTYSSSAALFTAIVKIIGSYPVISLMLPEIPR